jgi:hypothetical protein
MAQGMEGRCCAGQVRKEVVEEKVNGACSVTRMEGETSYVFL